MVVNDTTIPRAARAAVLTALTDTRVVMIDGPRQSGKSTLAAAIAREDHPATIRSLDDEDALRIALADPIGFLANLGTPAVIDEVQRAPNLILAIKASVDRDQRPGRYLLTGSADFLTAPRIPDSLVGRVERVRLWPFSQSEVERTSDNVVDGLFAGEPPRIDNAPTGRAAFVERAARGGFPQARLRDERRRFQWFTEYVDGLLVRDLGELANLRRADQAPRLLRVLASQSAGLLNLRNLSRSLDMAFETVQSYTKLLETVFLVRRSPAWRTGTGTREGSLPKVYVTDTGLLAYLLTASEERITTDDLIAGRMFETFVATEVGKQIEWARGFGIDQLHWRDGPDEVDIVLENADGRVVGIEAKVSATIRPEDARGLAKLRDRLGDRFVCGVVVSTSRGTHTLGDRLWAVPVSGLWSG